MQRDALVVAFMQLVRGCRREVYLDPLDNVFFENTTLLEQKLNPDNPQRSVQATRVLIHDLNNRSSTSSAAVLFR